MIKVTQLNGSKMVVNAELIESVEACHDTLLTTTTGKKLFVAESPDEIISRTVEYKRAIHSR